MRIWITVDRRRSRREPVRSGKAGHFPQNRLVNNAYPFAALFIPTEWRDVIINQECVFDIQNAPVTYDVFMRPRRSRALRRSTLCRRTSGAVFSPPSAYFPMSGGEMAVGGKSTPEGPNGSMPLIKASHDLYPRNRPVANAQNVWVQRTTEFEWSWGFAVSLCWNKILYRMHWMCCGPLTW